MVLAISFTLLIRPLGTDSPTRDSIFASVSVARPSRVQIGVRVAPGTTTFTRTPVSASSDASTAHRANRPRTEPIRITDAPLPR